MYHNTSDHLQHEKYLVLCWEDGARQYRKVSKDEYKRLSEKRLTERKKDGNPVLPLKWKLLPAQGLQGELEVQAWEGNCYYQDDPTF